MSEQSSLSAGLLIAARELQTVKPDAKNTHHGYEYASAEAVIRECRRALASGGIATSREGWSYELLPSGVDATVTIEVKLRHESGESMQGTVQWPAISGKGRPLDKALAGALTTAYSFWLLGVCTADRGEAVDDVSGRDDRAYEPQPHRSTARASSANDVLDDIHDELERKASEFEAQINRAATDLDGEKLKALREPIKRAGLPDARLAKLIAHWTKAATWVGEQKAAGEKAPPNDGVADAFPDDDDIPF